MVRRPAPTGGDGRGLGCRAMAFLAILTSMAFGAPLAWEATTSDKFRLPRRITFEQLESASPYAALNPSAHTRADTGKATVDVSRFTDAKGVGHLLVRSRTRRGTTYLFRTRAGKEILLGAIRTPTELLRTHGHVELLTPISLPGSAPGYSVARDSGGTWRVCGDFAYQSVRSEMVPCDKAGRDGACSYLLQQAQNDARTFRDSRCLVAVLEGRGGCIEPPRPVDVELKPMIYLYPDAEKQVEVGLDPSIPLRSVYPGLHDRKWRVEAKPDGTLRDATTGKRYYGLFWESEGWAVPASDSGVVVRGENFAETLDSLLERKGLDFREREEFVTFWISRMAGHPWVSIQFHDQAFAASHPVQITPKPDIFLRVFAVFQGMDRPRSMKPPRIAPPDRHGFVAVEWGGKELEPIRP